jgi:diguanylate cyclase (GGDEF)-like protein
MTIETGLHHRRNTAAAGAAAVLLMIIGMISPPFRSFSGFGTSMLTVHLLLELFAIVIALLIVVIAWNTFDAIDESAPNVLISGLLIVAFCDIAHALTYAGMPDFLMPASTPRAIFFWLTGRSFEAITLLLVVLNWYPRIPKAAWLLLSAGIIVPLYWLGSWGLDYFPTTFIPGMGVTDFKAHYEYVLCLLNLVVAYLFWRKAARSNQQRDYLLSLSAFVMGIGEIMFTTYVAPSDFQNIFGHLFKLIAYSLLYWTTFVTSIRAPFNEIKRSQDLLRRSEERRLIATNSGQIAIWEVDLLTGKLTWDDNCFLLYKIDKERFNGTFEEWRQTVHPKDLDTVTKSFQNAVAGTGDYDLTFRIVWPEGEVRFIEAHGEVQRDRNGVAQRVIGTNWDVTTIKTQQSQLEHIAHFDALTNLPNRVLLADRLQQSILQCQRRSQQLAVAFMDLDGFKAINDQHGHAVGDQVLIGLAHRMNEVMRQGDTLARLGGDEFVAVLIDLEDQSVIEPLLVRLLAAVAQPIQVEGINLHVTASIGVTIYPQTHEIDADQLLRQADQSMYQAKLAGKNRYHVFDAVQDSSIRGLHESLEQVRTALERRQCVLFYQPKVNMRTGQVIGVEALIRWQHPEQGLLPPGAFLPVIEDHPLAIDIGEWVIGAALTQMELWFSQGMDVRVSVNVGARQLQEVNFTERLRAILKMHPSVDPKALQLEILETSALEDIAQISQVIEACAQLGVSFALDDFGTGYSSLTYLKRLKVKTLKIDQSFVRDMLEDTDDLAILEGVIGLAKALKREVIAEGVETPGHGAALLQLGCELAQGYGISRPMPADQMRAWAETWKPDPSWSN